MLLSDVTSGLLLQASLYLFTENTWLNLSSSSVLLSLSLANITSKVRAKRRQTSIPVVMKVLG